MTEVIQEGRLRGGAMTSVAPGVVYPEVSKHRKRMQAVGRSNTDLELKLRHALWDVGLRYRINRRVEGAKPDIVFIGPRVAIFVDGCFWHGCPTHYIAPVSNADFWRRRLELNMSRDGRDDERLGEAGWRVIRIWGCSVKNDLAHAVRVVSEAVKNPYSARR